MTDEQLAAIRARADAATPGPWKAFKNYDDYNTIRPESAQDCEHIFNCEMYGGTPPGDADAEFIASARKDIPALLDEIERLKQKLAISW